MRINYADVNVEWTARELKRLRKIQNRPIRQRSVAIRRAAVRMLYNCGMMPKEISQKLGMTEKAVDGLLRIGGYRLKRKLSFNKKTYVAHNYFNTNQYDKLRAQLWNTSKQGGHLVDYSA